MVTALFLTDESPMSRPLIVKPLVLPAAPNRLVAVDRAVAELRRGGMVALTDGAEGGALVLAAEGVSTRQIARLAELAGCAPQVVVSDQRAAALGLVVEPTHKVALVALAEGRCADQILRLIGPFGVTTGDSGFEAMAGTPPGWAVGAVALAKLARLLPAAVAAPTTRRFDDLFELDAADILGYAAQAARDLKRVAEARVPLAGAENCRVVAFRPYDGGIEHLAIIVGEPDRDAAVLTRLHSECFTGDLLGSLRCDCGEQLRGAIAQLAEAGAGILLYLTQEGRGIGLINKLRAYGLQDSGFDTLDANQQLGFDDDERIYLPAAEMLKLLGVGKVRLLTNNPSKVDGLSRHGIVVAERVPHVFPANGHNEFYLRTKATRSGHLL